MFFLIYCHSIYSSRVTIFTAVCFLGLLWIKPVFWNFGNIKIKKNKVVTYKNDFTFTIIRNRFLR